MRQHICKNCGKIYLTDKQDSTVCPACAAEIQKDVLRVKVCAMCGKPFSAPTPTVTCSAECAADLKRQRQVRADIKRGKAKPERLLGKKERTAPQSGIPGITWCRNKWQLTYKGNYIGVYDTVEAAKCKKLQLESGDTNAD